MADQFENSFVMQQVIENPTSTENRKKAAEVATNFFKGKIPDNELNSLISTLTSDDAGIRANGHVVCFLLYFRVHVSSKDNTNKIFVGNAGGLGSPAGGELTTGNIYLAKGVSFSELVAQTHAFQFNSAAVYLNVNFFAKHHKFLGSYQGGGAGICPGTGGGSGKWKEPDNVEMDEIPKS